MTFFRLAAALLAVACTVAPALAQEEPAAADLRPEARSFATVIAAMEDQSWDSADLLAAPMGQTARDLVTWERLRAGAGTFEEYTDFAATHADWPGLDGLREAGEAAIPADADPAAVVAYFEEQAPQTGRGVVMRARALEELGRGEEAEAAVIEAWLTLGLDRAGQTAILAAFGELLEPYHAARAEAMLWRWRTSDAAGLMDLLPEGDQALTRARTALIRGDRNADDLAEAVPEPLSGHPGLAYDRFNRLANGGDYTDAIALLSERTGSAESLGQPFRWASWRARLARWLMREGRPQEAYDLASRHWLTEGDFYADLEWLAGYIALTRLDGPEAALFHFDRMAAAVEGPISLGRAHYWRGRAYEAQGDVAAAEAAYAQGADYQTSFYGLLAADRLGVPLDPALADQHETPDWRAAAFPSQPLGEAATMLLDGGDRGAAVLFIVALAETLPEDEVAALGAWLAERDETWLSLLVGKIAVRRNILIPAIYHPLHAMADRDWPVETPLALAIARQESEFNEGVGSPVGALGLMQLMPGTAQDVSRDLGLPYSRARLTSDWAYNAALGTRYLQMLQERFGDSPVLIAAGYNAGPGRPMTWMGERGDPRREADVIDWIESIPFDETRNYVMRVTEAIPIYRARLGTDPGGPVRFAALLTGAPPVVRPVARPGSESPVETGAPIEAVTPEPAAPGGPAAPAAIRPIARPGG
ncbi:lytic transglycosylase domain-containing protein [Wenxinia marina]|uniref:Soluble lytic murein transglycosylase n=1 Tax=Wenxinia marina DSM 24838 TaxID=1123501 RepID=A0A0D0QER4_9RHOB|nr:lytic transglycosylase domain-containing protein [Wenxinia marina]KIQ70827.1 Soluble lytic murein transglycosylase [Wenxinia marina DSM 24838]GGL56986.1 lytic transglycosylase [Wenxinia marina]